LLSIIILSKNNGRTIGYTLLSLLRAKVPSGYSREIIVVDAKSSDNTPKILSAFGKFIKVVYDEGRGIGIARNIGVSSSRGDIICFVDADCVVSEDHFLRIISEFENGADVIDVKGSSPKTETIIEKWNQYYGLRVVLIQKNFCEIDALLEAHLYRFEEKCLRKLNRLN